MSTALVWFRRDLRLADNPALHVAAQRHARVLPVYVHAPGDEAGWAPGAASDWWLHHSLLALDGRLRRRGAGLLILRGDALEQLRGLAAAVRAESVYWNRLYEPALAARDARVAAALRADGLETGDFNAALLVEPWELRTGSGAPYRVFTPFWRSAQAAPRREPLPSPRMLKPPAAPAGLQAQALGLLPRKPWDQGFYQAWQPGEEGAWAALERFCAGAAAQYRERRDFPAEPATSRLSPHLHFGEIGPAQVAARLRRLAAESDAAGGAVEPYLRQLGWREFAHHLLHHFPHTPEQPLDPRFAGLAWRAPPDYAADLRAWRRGRTGIPIIDAGMRELWHSGWMHNRVRMLAASFLTKNLLVPWQEGARWFWDTLVDADLANNTLGWQWTAGCGADAAPYFRVFNPLLQAARFDPAGAYLRRWLPELARLPDAALHAPWQAAPAVLAAAGVRLGQDYPLPVVDLAASRGRALRSYAQLKGGGNAGISLLL
ncbi:MAG: deoxyribodipyrimidine photo-lyase [Nevskia sp.]|nr:deoxyribodipyrimidine photo-lyase [Nevskia sp.]